MKKKTHFNLGELQELTRCLGTTAYSWVPQLFPAGQRMGRDWRVGDIDGRKGLSLSVRLLGEKAGCFIDHADSNIAGGPIELIRIAYGISFTDAVHQALQLTSAPIAKYAEEIKAEEHYIERDKARVMHLYGKRRSLKDSIAGKYLESRGVVTWNVQDLFAHANLPHWPEKTNFPAMLAAVRDKNGELIGIHRTYLDATGATKADVVPNKMMLGQINGGAVRLYSARQKVGIAEGIETAMSAHDLFNVPVWAALSSAGMKNIQLPDTIKEVIIFGDYDEAGREAANALADRLTAEGILVSKAFPVIPGTDFNDQLLARK